MYHCIPMAYGKIQIQTLTHGYQDWQDPDVFQNVMSKLVQDMEYVKTYLDDLLILTNSSFKDHLLKLEMRNGSSKTLNRWYESEHFQI
jgi:predicted thioredoxin/glutaredoxin